MSTNTPHRTDPPRVGSSIHRCHAHECHVPIEPRLLMCKRHWFMVPAQLRRRVLAHYRRGQEIDKNPTAAYLAAHLRAVAAVAHLDGYDEEARVYGARAADQERVAKDEKRAATSPQLSLFVDRGGSK